MSNPQTSRWVDERVEALYSRHLSVDEASVAKYYESGRGYYDPREAGDRRNLFALALGTTDGEVYEAGDRELRFPLQSISKVFVYGLALEDHGRERVLERVGVEPSGDAFSSLTFDERANRPYNPMVNAGALVTTDMVCGGGSSEGFERILVALRRYAGNSTLASDQGIFDAELRTADRNRATAYLMRSDGMLGGDIEETLALYLRVCSVQVTCRDLAVMAATLANAGLNPITGERALARERTRDVLSVMHTSGCTTSPASGRTRSACPPRAASAVEYWPRSPGSWVSESSPLASIPSATAYAARASARRSPNASASTSLLRLQRTRCSGRARRAEGRSARRIVRPGVLAAAYSRLVAPRPSGLRR